MVRQLNPVARFCSELNHGDAGMRFRACAGLSALGRAARAALPELHRRLTDEVFYVREAAIDALASVNGPDACAALIPCLSDPHWRVRERAARVLGELRARAAPAALALRQALCDMDPAVREAAALALEKIPSASSTMLAHSHTTIAA
ncbi:MAG TPA: HEAT repeat domain-containing protein [Planctomycetota bacterium]|nr:HEAT repeat domain-containing protein [Planctomycetota bacterium]